MPDGRVTMPKRAMVLAAGLGLRMRPITESTPKPLVKVHDRTLLDHALDRLQEVGIETVVVNTHYKAERVRQHLRKREQPHIVISEEPALLDTGGGVKRALPDLGDEPFFVVNSDALWLNGPRCALTRLMRHWDGDKMDALLLCHSTVEAHGYTGKGDFLIDPWGRLARRPECEVSPYLFTGVQVLHPRVFEDTPDGAFSLNLVYDRLMEAERLYGVVHDGEWFHVGTPDGLAEAEAFMNVRYPGAPKR